MKKELKEKNNYLYISIAKANNPGQKIANKKIAFTLIEMSNPFAELNSRLDHIEHLLNKVITNTSLKSVKMSEENDLVTFKEAIGILHMSEDRLYSVHKDLFKARRSGKKLLFSRQELIKYLNRDNS